MRTRLLRCNAVFKSKYQFIFETSLPNITTVAKVVGKPYREHAVILYDGIPLINDVIVSKHLEPKTSDNIFYINYNNMDLNLKSKTAKYEIITQSKMMIKNPKPLISSEKSLFKGKRESLSSFMVNEKVRENIHGQSREFLSDLIVIGQFDKKAIIAKRTCEEFDEIWMFDQHACAERINLENLMNSSVEMTRDEMNMRACRSAIKFGDLLDLNEQMKIIKNLESCQEPFHCAHGRPTCWLLAKINKSS